MGGLNRRSFLKGSSLSLLSAFLGFPRIEAAEPEADLILNNGKIITVDARENIAQAIAVKAGRILEVGTSEQIARFRGSATTMVELKGRTVTPGLIDSHAHLPHFGQRENGWYVNVQMLEKKEEIMEKLAERARRTPEGRWILSWGIESLDLSFFNRDELDRVSKNHPILIAHTGGQWGYANSLALRIAGITKETPDPPGSRINRSFFGEPTGLLVHYPALELVRKFTPPPNPEEAKMAIAFAAQLYASEGVTTIHDNFFSLNTPYFHRAYFELIRTGAMPVRVKIWPYIPNLEVAKRIHYALFINPRDERLPTWIIREMVFFLREAPELFAFLWGGFKFAADGGGGTSLWYDNPNRLPMHKKEELAAMVKLAHQAGHQVSVHAVGDMAVDWTLEAYEAAQKAHPRRDARHRIEHAWSPHPSSLQRLKDLEVVISTHPQWLYHWGENNLQFVSRLEKVGRSVMPIRSYLEKGIAVAFGADPPAFPYYQPQMALWQALARSGRKGYSFAPSERISLKQALRLQTMGGAYAAFQEKMIGSLETGKRADMVIWDKDLSTIPEGEIRQVKAIATFLEGKLVHKAKEADFIKG